MVYLTILLQKTPIIVRSAKQAQRTCPDLADCTFKVVYSSQILLFCKFLMQLVLT